MCGISGMFTTGDPARASRIVEAIVRRQRHRGPDAQAVKTYRAKAFSVVLGHNRLSIIDLSESANQPMQDASGRYHLVFNGEFYNYLEVREELRAHGIQFRTQSDTEVLIEAFKLWGTDSFGRMNGMFAFALLDEKAERLYLVRDRFGVKPLYYYSEGKDLAFASEPGEIATQYGLGANFEFIARGLRRSVFENGSEESQYAGITSLPAGCFIEVSAKNGIPQAKSGQWYDLRHEVERTKEELRTLSNREIIDRLNDLIDSSVELRLRADVPIALSLSGGLDSNIICASLCKSGRGLEAFSYGKPDDEKSEGPIVKRTGERLGVKVHWIDPTEADVLDAYLRTLKYQDEPFVNGAQVAQFLICERAHQHGFKVLLGGQGADEAFMGYRKYFPFAAVVNAREKHFVRAASFAIQTAAVAWSERRQTAAFWRQRKTFSMEDCTSRLELPPPSLADSNRLKSGQKTWERQLEDVTRFSLPTLLRYEDRNSMAHSLEGRLPFMDYRIVELGLALPDELKMRKAFGKWALREATKGLIPDEIRATRSKVGFATSQPTWIRNGLGAKLRTQLEEFWPEVRGYCREGLNPEESFSDNALVGDRSAVPEILALIWLGFRHELQRESPLPERLAASG
jgi:asparagine synthase (glutamine-hydrolysing)